MGWVFFLPISSLRSVSGGTPLISSPFKTYCILILLKTCLDLLCIPYCCEYFLFLFTIFFLHRANIPFQQAHHLVNPWNDHKKVQISRDGQVSQVFVLSLCMHHFTILPNLNWEHFTPLFRGAPLYCMASKFTPTNNFPSSLITC